MAVHNHRTVGDEHHGVFRRLIHVDDAVELLLAVMTVGSAADIELGCDGNPAPRIDYYRQLAQMTGSPLPQPMSDDEAEVRLGVNRERLRIASSKALDNIPTCRRTGWRPRFSNFRAGLEAVLGGLDGGTSGR